MRHSAVWLLLIIIISAVALGVGCAARQGTAKPEPAGSQDPYVETRVYDIRDLINRAPDFDNAPDFNLQGSQPPIRSSD